VQRVFVVFTFAVIPAVKQEKLMFDTYLDRRSVNVRQDTHITQQPHDAADAARLYGELEEKALDRVQNTMVMQLPSIDAKVVRFDLERQPATLSTFAKIGINLNGKPVIVTYL